MEASAPDPVQSGYFGSVYGFDELRETGLLWLINAAVLHPRGFALALVYPDEANAEGIAAGLYEPVGWKILGDGSEPWQFAAETADGKFSAVEKLLGPV